MYIIKNKFAKFAQVVVIGLALVFTFSCSGGDFKYGSMKDNNGKTYKTIKIGKQTWMAENLNFDVPDNDTDVCYGNDPANCNKYGRLYNWKTAMSACPNGWHLPSEKEWDELVDFVGDRETAGKYLKSKNGWNENGNGEDKYGFFALPGGGGLSVGSFVGFYGCWWGSSEYNSGSAYSSDIRNDLEYVFGGYVDKDYLFSVRCVQD